MRALPRPGASSPPTDTPRTWPKRCGDRGSRQSRSASTTSCGCPASDPSPTGCTETAVALQGAALAHQLVQVREKAALGQPVQIWLHVRVGRWDQLRWRGRPGRLPQRAQDQLLALLPVRPVLFELRDAPGHYRAVGRVDGTGLLAD